MQRSTWLIIAAVLYALFGLGLLVVPVQFMAAYGVALDANGALMARILGSALTAFALLFWWGRDDATTPMMIGVLRASFVYNVVDFVVVLSATLAGTMNALGWAPVLLHVFLAAGFGYFAFMKR